MNHWTVALYLLAVVSLALSWSGRLYAAAYLWLAGLAVILAAAAVLR